MNDFVFHSPTEFIFGRGVEVQAGERIARCGGRRVLIVCGGGSARRSGLLDRVVEALDSAGLTHSLLEGVRPNPTDEKVREGIRIGRTEGTDWLLAIGGGSVIDTAKAIAAGLRYAGDFWDFFDGTATVTEALPIGVVLTIPAAGSEGSGNSVITKTSTRQKLSLRTPYVLRPKFALLNPELTLTLPAWQTACGITDMLAHIMERYFTNTPATVVTDHVSEGLMQAIVEEARRVTLNPQDYDARANLMWAGTLAHNGLCGTGCEEDWASHFMEHEVSAFYDVSHGAGLAVIFPAWLQWMAVHHATKVAQWAERVWGVSPAATPQATAEEGVRRFRAFLASIGMPLTLRELGIEHPDINKLADSLHRNKGEFVGNYVRLTRKDTEEIYRLAQ